MMIFPHKSRRTGTRSPRTAVPLRGLFLDGVWRCNCPERPPALKLQTKNHGVNHGRWFYTCQNPQQHRCNFFLWASDAEAREKLAVLSNSRSEHSSTPKTPSKTSRGPTGLLTPQTGSTSARPETDRSRRTAGAPPERSSAKARMMTEDTDEFEWDDAIDFDSEVERIFDRTQPMRQPDFGAPERKRPRAEVVTSPGKGVGLDMGVGKRRREATDEVEEGEGRSQSATLTPGSISSVVGGKKTAGDIAGRSPFLTPTPTRYKNAVSGSGESPLASSVDLTGQVSRILEGHGVAVPPGAREELRGLFERYELQMKGIIRGRDISRVALRKKDEEIARLNERIVNLETEREMNRTVLGGLKHE